MEGRAADPVDRPVAEIRLKSATPYRLDAEARGVIAAALKKVFDDPVVEGVILTGPEGRFPAANDADGEGPSLAELCLMIEDAPKPVVAAIGVGALGPGFDIALAAHYRIAAAGAMLGFPEVRLGIVPEAGGTQRLPRIAGAAAALEVLLTGKPVTARAGLAMGVLDRIADGDVTGAAAAMIRELAGKTAPRPVTRKRTDGLKDAGGYLAACRSRRETVDEGDLEAPRRMIDCIEGALLLPFDAGLALEIDTRKSLAAGPEARALAHMARAEAMRVAPKALAAATPRPVKTIGIMGAGRTGTEIVLAALQAGFAVMLAERDEAVLEEAVLTVIEATDAEVDAGRLSAADGKARIARLSGLYGTEEFGTVDLAIEAVSDAGGDPAAALAELDAAARAGAVIAVTAAGQEFSALARTTSRVSDIVGLRVFPPMRRNRAAELHQGRDTSSVAGATLRAVLKQMARMTVITDGTAVADKLTAALYGAADWCLMGGATAEAIDAAIRDWGARLGPFEARDLAGGGRVPSALPGGLDAALWQAGKRYYTYRPNGERGPADQGVNAILDAARKRARLRPRAFSDEEIRDRCILAMVNAGAAAVTARQIARPSEIDILAVHGLGFARRRGGPMMDADRIGLATVGQRLQHFAPDAPMLWAPDPLIATLTKHGKTFGSLNG